MSQKLLIRKKEKVVANYFIPYHEKEIIKPDRFFPNEEFLHYPRENIFKTD